MPELAITASRYDKTQTSSVEWLGDIPSHWCIKRFKYIASIMTGDKDAVHSDKDGLYPFFIRSPKVQRINTYSYNGEAVLTAGDGDIGRIFHYACGKFDYHQRVYKFSDFKYASGRYIYYFLHHNLAEEVVKLSAKTTVDSLRLPFLQNFPLAVPPLVEQAVIANFLDQKTAHIDAAISLKERQVVLFQERKQILIQQAVIRGLDPHAPMQHSDFEWIGEIPTHWRIMANRALFRERVEPGREDLPLLSVSIHSGVSEEEISEEENIRGRVKIEDKTKYIRVRPGDIAFNMMRAWQGAIGAVRVEGMVSPAYTIAVPRTSLDGRYFEYQYRTPGFIQQMDRYSKGITDFRKRLYWDGFKQLITLVPPIEEQRTIVEFIEQTMLKQNAAVALLEEQITKLKEYKTTLINSAVTGKIKVPGVLEPAEIQEREIA